MECKEGRKVVIFVSYYYFCFFIGFVFFSLLSIFGCKSENKIKDNYFILEGRVLHDGKPVDQAEVGIVGIPPQKTDSSGKYKFSLKKGKYIIYAKKDNLAFSAEIVLTKNMNFDIAMEDAVKVYGKAIFTGNPKIVGVAFLPFFSPITINVLAEDEKYVEYTLLVPKGKHKIIFSERTGDALSIKYVDIEAYGEKLKVDEPETQSQTIICDEDFQSSKFVLGNTQASQRLITSNWFIYNFPCNLSSDFKYSIPISNPEDIDSDTIPNDRDPDSDGDGFDNITEIAEGTDPLSAFSFPITEISIRAITEENEGGVIIYLGDDTFLVSSVKGDAYLDVPKGKTISLTAFKKGYFPKSITFFPSSDNNNKIEILLNAAVVIRGKVLSKTSTLPIHSAKIKLYGGDNVFGRGLFGNIYLRDISLANILAEVTSSEDNGSFIIFLPRKSQYIISVERDGFFPYFDLVHTPWNKIIDLEIYMCPGDDKNCILSFILDFMQRKGEMGMIRMYLREFEKRFGRTPESNAIGIALNISNIIDGIINYGFLSSFDFILSEISDMYDRSENVADLKIKMSLFPFLFDSKIGYFGPAEAKFISAITRIMYSILKYITNLNLDFSQKFKEAFMHFVEHPLEDKINIIKSLPQMFSEKSLYFKEDINLPNFLRENLERAKIDFQKAYELAEECPSENIICKKDGTIYVGNISFAYSDTLDFFERAKNDFVSVDELTKFGPFNLPITFVKINLSKFMEKPLRDFLPEEFLIPSYEFPITKLAIELEKDVDSEHFGIIQKDGIVSSKGGIAYIKWKDPTFSGSLIVEKCYALNFAQDEGIENTISRECGWRTPNLQDINDILAIIQKWIEKREFKIFDILLRLM